MVEYEIRTVRPEEWRQVKALRLAALSDPVSRVAFGATYDQEADQPDEFWQRRARRVPVFVAADRASGGWMGSATVLVERGAEFPLPQTHVVGMYVLPEHRGSGVAEQLLRAAIDWSWLQDDIRRVRLWVTGDNARAFAFYTRLGFSKTGATLPHPPDPGITGYEMVLPRPLEAGA